jgi:hypothetical protein
VAARDNSRRDAGYEAEYEAGYDDIAHGERTADEDDLAYDGAAYDGMDALMAALIDEPLPEEALADAEFMDARRVAAADVALLRERLAVIGEALAGTETGTGPGTETGTGTGTETGTGTGTDTAEPGTEPETDAEAGAAPPGRLTAAPPGDAAGTETDPGPMPAPMPMPAPRPATAPVTPLRPLSTRPDRARRVRRARNAVLGTLAAAVAASAVLGVGWAVVQAGGEASTMSDRAGSGSDEAASRPDSSRGGHGDDTSGRLGHVGYLACARLVVEGTVTDVEPVAGAGQDRITLGVDRYYKPGKGADEIVFPMAEGVEPRLRKGDHVLIGIARGSAEPDLWTTDERGIARDRAWVETALPEAEGMRCE